MKIAFLLLSIFLIGIFVFFSRSNFGSSPNKKRQTEFAKTNNYNSKKEEFVNRQPDVIEDMMKKNMSLNDFIEFFKERKDSEPSEPLPEIKPNIAEFLKPSKDLKVIWFGHSSFLLNMDGRIILVDPVFSGSAAPVSFMVKRFQEPALSLNELPQIDYILISHDHYDHLDMDSVKFFKNKRVQFITPLGVGSHLEGWGIARDKVIEKNWWEDIEFEGLKFIATPAQHFSGRGLFDRNKTLWASWVIQSKNYNVYFSGDSGYDKHFKAIGEKYGPFDVAFIESGQYNEKWKEVHLLPAKALVAHKDLKAKKYFPVHWGMFVLAMHTWYDPVVQLFELSKDDDTELVVPKIGEIVNLSKPYLNQKWWQPENVAYQIRKAQ